MSAEARIARLHRIRLHERSAAARTLQAAAHARGEAQAAAERARAARLEAEREATAAAARPQAASEWLAQRALVADRMERERLAGVTVRRLGRQEALRRAELRAALVREEQMRLMGANAAARRQATEQRSEQRTLDDLRREGGDAQ